MTNETVYERSPDAVSTEPEPGKSVLLQLESGEYYALNNTGTVLWAALDTPQSLKTLSNTLIEQYKIESELAISDAEMFIKDLLARKLIVVA